MQVIIKYEINNINFEFIFYFNIKEWEFLIFIDNVV